MSFPIFLFIWTTLKIIYYQTLIKIRYNNWSNNVWLLTLVLLLPRTGLIQHVSCFKHEKLDWHWSYDFSIIILAGKHEFGVNFDELSTYLKHKWPWDSSSILQQVAALFSFSKSGIDLSCSYIIINTAVYKLLQNGLINLFFHYTCTTSSSTQYPGVTCLIVSSKQ